MQREKRAVDRSEKPWRFAEVSSIGTLFAYVLSSINNNGSSNASRYSVLLAALVLPATVTAKELVLTSPPRESADKAMAVFQPIAEHPSRVLGRQVVFKYSDNWLSYQSEMQKDLYDIVVDGPHFVSYRMTKHQHTPVVKLPGKFVFAIIAMKGNDRIDKLEDIQGRRLCATAPPNLGALTALAQYTNPSRQPILVDTKGFSQAYEALVNGKCVAAILQVKLLEKLEKDKKVTKLLFESKGLPTQAITASPRLDAAQHARLAEALLIDTVEAREATGE